jgi:Arf-GAP/coiled-coil/ANK repeat/PH domain-containing protein
MGFSLEIFFRGANPAAMDINGKTPLQTAVEIGALTDEELFLMLS